MAVFVSSAREQNNAVMFLHYWNYGPCIVLLYSFIYSFSMTIATRLYIAVKRAIQSLTHTELKVNRKGIIAHADPINNAKYSTERINAHPKGANN